MRRDYIKLVQMTAKGGCDDCLQGVWMPGGQREPVRWSVEEHDVTRGSCKVCD